MRARGWLLILWLGAALPPHAAGGPPPAERLFGLFSREAKVVLWVGQREAAGRRARRIPAAKVLGELGEPELLADLNALWSQASLFLPPDLLAAAPALLERGRGAAALSVEGFVLDGGVPYPDVLLAADAEGMEGLVGALRARTQSGGGGAPLPALPFELSADPPRIRRSPHGVDIVEFRTAGGHRAALAEVRGLILGARSAARIEQGLGRMFNASQESLLDSDRFLAAWRTLAPRDSDLCWYADLRRIRLEASFAAAQEGPLRDLFMEGLAAFDGAALAGRGVGDTFHVRAFLERGKRPGGTPPLLLGGRVLRAPALLPRPVSAGVFLHMEARQAGDVLLPVARWIGGSSTGQQVADLLAPLGGERYLALLADHLGDELAVFQPGGAQPGESLPRVAFLIPASQPKQAEAWFARTSAALGPRRMRRTEVSGAALYEVALERDPFLPRPAFTIWRDQLLGANNVLVLRRLLEALDGEGTRLDRDDAFLAPFDRLDVAVHDAASALFYCDSRGVAEAASTWFGGLYQLLVASASIPTMQRMHQAVLLLDDPEFQESLRGMAARVRTVEGGLTVEWIGP